MSRFTKFLIWLSPRKLYIPTQVQRDKTWVGSSYGGFFVHLAALNSQSTVLSFGVGEDISFDLSLIKEKGLHVHTFDPTPAVFDFIGPHLNKNPNLKFTPVGLGAANGEMLFYPPGDETHISCSVVPNQATRDKAYRVKMKKLSTLLKERNLTEVDLLKMDIEGAEFEVIPQILEEGIKYKQLQMEIHPELIPGGAKRTRMLIKNLNRHGYKLFGVSDTCRELSFIR